MHLIEIKIDAKYIFQSAILFSLATAIILVFIILSLFPLFKQSRRRQHLRSVFSSLVSEIIICESEDELAATMRKPFVQTIIRTRLSDKGARWLLIRELVKVSRSLSGSAAGNVRWLYNELGLEADTLKDLEKGRWYTKAHAIQVLAEMKQEKYIRRIYKRINNKNIFVHSEAQVAVVKLLELEGLRFLNVLDQPLSQWQQLQLLNQLPEYGDFETSKIDLWVHSKNPSVVEFALKLVCRYKLYEFHDDALWLLQSGHEYVRAEAARALAAINSGTTVGQLIRSYKGSGEKTRWLILQLVESLGAKEHLDFMVSVAGTEKGALKVKALRVIESLQPPGN